MTGGRRSRTAARLRRLLCFIAAAVVFFIALPAAARDVYVVDDAHVLSEDEAEHLRAELGGFAAATGKRIVVHIAARKLDTPLPTAAKAAYAKDRVAGVLIFVAGAERKVAVLGSPESREWFTPDVVADISHAITAGFAQRDEINGIDAAVALAMSAYQRELGAGSGPVSSRTQPAVRERSFPLLVLLGFLAIVALVTAVFLVRLITDFVTECFVGVSTVVATAPSRDYDDPTFLTARVNVGGRGARGAKGLPLRTSAFRGRGTTLAVIAGASAFLAGLLFVVHALSERLFPM